MLRGVVGGGSLSLIQNLLHGNKAQILAENSLSAPFNITVGTPQGDGHSPMPFAIYLEHCLREVRLRLPPRPAGDSGFESETQCAGDCNWHSGSKQWPGMVCDTVVIRRGQTAWRKPKQLGSLLGGEEDVDRRIQLSVAAFGSLEQLWHRGNRIDLRQRVRLRNAVLPTLTYNAASRGLGLPVLKKVNAHHRRHLRIVAGTRYPRRAHDEGLYEVTGAVSVESPIRSARWRMFGHVLRLPRETPAQCAVDHYFEPGVRPRGRPRVCLPKGLDGDLAKVGKRFKASGDFGAFEGPGG